MEINNINEFSEYVREHVNEYLSSEYDDCSITINEIHKNNETLKGLSILKQGENVAPLIYLESEYETYRSGQMSIDETVKGIASLRETLQVNMPNIDITDFKNMISKIRPKLISIAGNEEMLKSMPYKEYDGLACCYYIDVDKDRTIRIDDQVMKLWNESYDIPLDKLHDVAITNQRMYDTPKFDCVYGVMNYITTRSKTLGASAILDDKFMDSIASEFGDNCIVIPSSIHEQILWPATPESVRDLDNIKTMIKEVNQSMLTSYDVLSEEPYAYDFKQHKLVKAEKYFDKLMNEALERGESISFEMEF